MRISDGSADVCSSDLSKLLLSKPLKKWILLVPVHDSKDVNMHCAKKTADLRGMDLALLDPDFEVCVHDQKQFPGKALHDAMRSEEHTSELQSLMRISYDVFCLKKKKKNNKQKTKM